jgi:hypothetical protein
MRRTIWRAFSSVPAVLEVGRDAGAAEGVVAHFGGGAGRLGAPAHHGPSIGPVQPLNCAQSSPIENEAPSDRRQAKI